MSTSRVVTREVDLIIIYYYIDRSLVVFFCTLILIFTLLLTCTTRKPRPEPEPGQAKPEFWLWAWPVILPGQSRLKPGQSPGLSGQAKAGTSLRQFANVLLS